MIRILTLILWFPAKAFADYTSRPVVIPSGISQISYTSALTKLITFLAGSAASVVAVIFLVGAVYTIGSAGKPELLEKGKKLMKNSLIGLAIVLGSYTIFRTVWYLLY